MTQHPDRETAQTAPALRPPRWSGAKTAVTAALAITVASGGAVAAASALPQGTSAQGGPGVGQGGGQQPPWRQGYASGGQRKQQPGQGQPKPPGQNQGRQGQVPGGDSTGDTAQNGTDT